ITIIISGRPLILEENGQLPVYYNYKSSYQAMNYVDYKRKALFKFGYGLDYTEYIYREKNFLSILLLWNN
ncbi:MAG: hypothetical protein PHC56_01785, partial [Herbinix sp.]|nr:hypothetical protein [Herbinix sp.]